MALSRFMSVPLVALMLVASVARAEGWKSFIDPQRLAVLQRTDPSLVVIDARSGKDYANGHIPGAISLPGDLWRTPQSKPAEGTSSQLIFHDTQGRPDVARYEAFLSQAGLTRDRTVVVYGDHAGKANGSIPAMLLSWLGQEQVYFLDGIGLDRWQAAGFPVSTDASTLPPATYEARPVQGFVWSLDDVRQHLGDSNVLFYDTRSKKEFTGEDRRDNARVGHLPGAVLIDYAEFLTRDGKTVISPEQVKARLDAAGVSQDKTIVLYCQTATRVSLPYLALKDLGYTNVKVYAGSWHEWGNRDDTPIATPPSTQPAAAAR